MNTITVLHFLPAMVVLLAAALAAGFAFEGAAGSPVAGGLWPSAQTVQPWSTQSSLF